MLDIAKIAEQSERYEDMAKVCRTRYYPAQIAFQMHFEGVDSRAKTALIISTMCMKIYQMKMEGCTVKSFS